MKIVIRTVSDVYREEKPPCQNAVLHKVIGTRNEWMVDVNTIEDVLKISKETGKEICVKASGNIDAGERMSGFFDSDNDIPVLTVYDDWRE